MLGIMRQQKEAARVTELAVRRFEAEVLRSQSRISFVQQQVTATEYRINQLVGRFPQPVQRSTPEFLSFGPPPIAAGVPAQLLANRPDIRMAELNLQAARIDVKVAKANFYPSLVIDGNLGYEAFNIAHLLRTPESLAMGLAGRLAAPLINRNGLVATYNTANAHQIQRLYEYEQSLVVAYTEVATQLANIGNLQQAYDKKFQQVQALADGIGISQSLFRNARADYNEVLLTQREYLEARVDLVELKMLQLQAIVNTYRALGGGWQ
jgi:outer membrane protein TolC